KLLNDRSRRIPAHIQRAREAYYAMSLHVDGAAPAYMDLRNNVTVKPYNYFGKEYQRIFDTKLFARYPRESEVTREFRKSQYRPFTKDPFQAAINFTVGALFHDSGYNIQIENEDDNAYIWGANFEGGDIGQFFQKHFKSICVDANGFFVVIPKEPAAETTTERIEPDIWFVPSIKVLHLGLDSIIFERGDITWVVTDLAYYRIAKDPKTGDYYPLDDEWYY